MIVSVALEYIHQAYWKKNDNLFFTAEEADVELKNLLQFYNQQLKLAD